MNNTLLQVIAIAAVGPKLGPGIGVGWLGSDLYLADVLEQQFCVCVGGAVGSGAGGGG